MYIIGLTPTPTLDAFNASIEQLLDPPHDPMSDLRKMTPLPLRTDAGCVTFRLQR